jgi:hypothetical protein
MVLLTMTPAVAAAVKIYLERDNHEQLSDEPVLEGPKLGNPISHRQLIDVSKYLKENPAKVKGVNIDGRDVPVYLNELMRGCFLYTPPPKPKPEPVSLNGCRETTLLILLL